MRSINKRELFIQSWELFKSNFQFLINVGMLLILLVYLIQGGLEYSLFGKINVLDGLTNPQYILFKVAYSLITTGITLGITVQLIKIARLKVIESFADIFNYFNKIIVSLVGSLIVALVLGILAIIFIILFMGISSMNLESIEMIMSGEEVSAPLTIGVVGYIIIMTYLSLKTYFLNYFILDKDMGPVQALSESLTRTTGFEFELFIIYALLILINMVGFALFYVGLVFTIPYSGLVVSVIYTRYLSD